MTLTDSILAFVVAHPGRTAWHIAKGLAPAAGVEAKFLTGSVSSLLTQLTKVHRVYRLKDSSGSLTYYKSWQPTLRSSHVD